MKALMIIMVTYYHSLSVSTQAFPSLDVCNQSKTIVSETISPTVNDENFWTATPHPKVQVSCVEIKE